MHKKYVKPRSIKNPYAHENASVAHPIFRQPTSSAGLCVPSCMYITVRFHKKKFVLPCPQSQQIELICMKRVLNPITFCHFCLKGSLFLLLSDFFFQHCLDTLQLRPDKENAKKKKMTDISAPQLSLGVLPQLHGSTSQKCNFHFR